MYSLLLGVLLLVLVVGVLYIYSTALRVPSLDLNGAHVIVTGGSSGIGLELGMELARRGI
jgi:3-dehydrosphinganine reductase